MRLFVGNIPFSMSEDQIRELFEEFGSIVNCKLIMNRDTGRSKGFGFVEFETKEEAEAAIAAMNNKEVQGKALVVNEARPQEKKDFRNKERRGPRPPRRY